MINYSAATMKDLEALGFGHWSEGSRLMLIPLKLYDTIPDGTILTSISGRVVTKGKDEIDLDTRFGCIAFGLTPAN